ncbi:hypothetical protein Psfp_00217 [Pelotomaculum sp. FP]|uniref:copper amine oxidase N-terminal domain-containing protein n=1 Tax=Pelotomaculum sp. FP TaxID=261474 RepID=UPI0011020583|nr:copper amine oxidase N-terminal domain-containing protein [Pelotomaculum sp. FP]TEB17725.1 hypothetical protein Psfp_00217 [Pelotomaculum sp. FP]
MKLKRKALSILMTLCFLAAMIVPTATPAFASGDFTPLSAPNVDDGVVTALGGVLVKITAGSLQEGHSINFSLPSDFVWVKASGTDSDDVMTGSDWSGTVSGSTYSYGQKAQNGNYIEIPEKYAGDNNGLYGVDLKVKQISDKEISVTVDGEPSSGDEYFLYVYPKKIWVEDGYDGTIDLVATRPNNSGFPKGTVTIGNVTGGEVAVSVSGEDSFTDSDEITFRVTEDTAGSLSEDDESLIIKLPSGFTWAATGGGDDITVSADNIIWGDERAAFLDGITITCDEDELTIGIENESNEATSFEFDVKINVDDETDAKTGEITAKLSGDSDVTPSELVVGAYGTYDVEITAGDVPTVYAGMLEQAIAPITISESVAESLINGRTLTLELPENARWGALDDDNDSGLRIDLVNFPGKDGKTVKFEFKASNGTGSTDAAELVLDDLEVVLEPGVTGDLVVKVGGTAGLSDELTVAKIVTPITVEATGKPEVKIGTVNEIGEVTISETEAGAINKDEWVVLDLPTGVRFANKPKVEVVEGDLNVDTGSMKSQEDDNQMTFYIDGESSEASKIKVSNINYIVDRTVAEGDIVFKVKGSAVADVNDPEEVEDYYGSADISAAGVISIDSQEAFKADSVTGGYAIFSRSGTNASCVNAKVVTPAPEGTSAVATFTIGAATYTVNGNEATMDVAPYLKNDRTFLPVRYVANALGVADANIMWNQDEQSVVIIKGDRVIKLVMNSNIMLINGVPFTMDVAPELVDPGRTMLPLRAVAQALGADVQWDAATQTVTVTTI